ncbi:AI-2E family transporter [Reinekea sp. G2M2-21]|uniref:AI-2E family transporter n=1 Tax=Reinekea sp. G2M2-21 TaxID=2788942 RepID=UPI0018A93BEA|nr:AI-2E family transporter [Reinekea sp. G2M2-21]
MNESPLTRTLVIAASVIIILAGLKVAQPIVVPVLVAFFLAVLTSPAISFLVRFKIPAGIAIAIVVISLFGFFYALGTLVATSTDQFIERLPDYQNRIQSWLVTIQNNAPWLVDDAKERIANLQPTQSALSLLGSLFSGLGSVLTAMVLVVFTLIFALLEGQNATKKARIALDDNTIQYIKRFSKLVQRYLLVKSLISLATGFLVGLMLWIIDVDYPFLWGTFAFLMNYIPNIGSLLAAIPPVILASIQHAFPGFLITGSGFIAINMIVGNLIEPRMMGKSLDISPLVVFLSLIFWGWIFGPIGMLLSIPLTVVVKIGLEVYPKTKWLAQIISQ